MTVASSTRMTRARMRATIPATLTRTTPAPPRRRRSPVDRAATTSRPGRSGSAATATGAAFDAVTVCGPLRWLGLSWSFQRLLRGPERCVLSLQPADGAGLLADRRFLFGHQRHVRRAL